MKNATVMLLLYTIVALATLSWHSSSVEARPKSLTYGLDKLELKRFQMWFIMNRACAVANKQMLFACALEQRSNKRLSRKEKFRLCLNPIKTKCAEEKKKATVIYKEFEQKLRNMKRTVKKLQA